MFSAISNRSEELGSNLDPSTINVDFELAVMKPIASLFGSHVKIQGYFYHQIQNTGPTIQELGIAHSYRSDNQVKLFCRMMDVFAYLPLSQVKNRMPPVNILRGT